MLIYYKGIENEIEMKSPGDFGGMNSDEYRALNPQGKIPVLILPDGQALYESRVISAYLAEKFRDVGPSILPSTPPRHLRSFSGNRSDMGTGLAPTNGTESDSRL